MHVSVSSVALLFINIDLIALEGRKMRVELFGCVRSKVAFAVKALKLCLFSLKWLKNCLSFVLALDHAATATWRSLNLSWECLRGITEIYEFLINLLFAEFLEVWWLRTRSISLTHRYRRTNLVKPRCLVSIVHISIRISSELQWLLDRREFFWATNLNVAIPYKLKCCRIDQSVCTTRLARVGFRALLASNVRWSCSLHTLQLLLALKVASIIASHWWVWWHLSFVQKWA